MGVLDELTHHGSANGSHSRLVIDPETLVESGTTAV